VPHNAMQIRCITQLGRPTKILTIQLSCTDQWDTITRAAIATYEMHELVDGSASKKSDLLYIELGLGGQHPNTHIQRGPQSTIVLNSRT